MAQPIGKGQAGGAIPQQRAQDNSATTRAISNLGGAIAQTGKLAEQMQAEKERQQLGEVEIEMKKQSGALQVKLARAANPEEHLQIANDHFRVAEDKILNGKNYSRKFRNDLSQRLKMYSATQIEKIGTDAKLMQISNGRKIHNARIEARLADNLPEEAIAMVREGAGLYYPDEMGEIKIDQIKRKLRNEEYQSEVRAGNAEFFDQDLPLSDGDKARFRKQAETQRAANEKEDLSLIGDAIEIKDITTRDELETALDGAPYVSDLMKQKALQNWDNSQPLSFEEKKDILDRLNGLFSAFSSGQIDREDYARQHHEITSEIHALSNREGASDLKARSRAIDPNTYTKGKAIEGASDQAIEEEVKIMTSLGRFGRTESIDQDKMSEGEIRAIFDQRKVNANLREYVEDSVKAWSLTPDGQEAIANDPKAIQKKSASVLAEVMTDDMVEDMDADEDQLIYEQATTIEKMGAGDTALPVKGLIETEYELNDKGGFSPNK